MIYKDINRLIESAAPESMRPKCNVSASGSISTRSSHAQVDYTPTMTAEEIERRIKGMATRALIVGALVGLLGGFAIGVAVGVAVGFAIGYSQGDRITVIPLSEGIKT